MNEKELLEEYLIKSVNRMQTDISEIKDRTLKIEKRELQRLKIELLKLKLLWKMKQIETFNC